MKKFKITIPENPISKEQIINMNKGMFTKDYNKEGILAKTFIFTFLNQPVTATELSRELQGYYHTEFDRTMVYRNLKKLVDKGIIVCANIHYILAMPENDRKEIQVKAVSKYMSFIRTLPEQFRKNFDNINYFWVANGEGHEYVEWCCRLLNFNCVEEKDDN